MATQPTKVITGKCRLSYAHVWEPYNQNPDDPDSKAKYSCVLLIPKSDKVTMKKLRAAEAAAMDIGKTTRFNGKVPPNLRSIIRDGDEEKDLEQNPEYEGHYFLSVSSNQKPGIVDQNVSPIMDSSEVYSGCYVRASLNAFPYSVKGNKGISFGLNHLQKLGDGEMLGGRTRAADDFDEVESDEDGII